MYYDLPPPPLFYHKIVICTIKHFMLIAIVHMKLLHILLLYDSYMVPTGFLEDVERAKKNRTNDNEHSLFEDPELNRIR